MYEYKQHPQTKEWSNNYPLINWRKSTCLDAQEQECVRLLFAEGWSVSHIVKKLGVSRGEVIQALKGVKI